MKIFVKLNVVTKQNLVYDCAMQRVYFLSKKVFLSKFHIRSLFRNIFKEKLFVTNKSVPTLN